MKEKKEMVLLTPELFQEIMSNIIKQEMELKHQQGECLDRISLIKEILKNLKGELKELKSNIRQNKKQLRLEKKSLRKINSDLDERNQIASHLNINFTSEDETRLNLDSYQKKLGIK